MCCKKKKKKSPKKLYIISQYMLPNPSAPKDCIIFTNKPSDFLLRDYLGFSVSDRKVQEAKG